MMNDYRTQPCGKCKLLPSAHTILGMNGTRQIRSWVKPHGFVMGGK